MTSKETIIQLRQKDPTAEVKANGDYEIQLSQPVILKQGSEVSLKGCFIDTSAEESTTSLISVLSNEPTGTKCNCEIDFIYYFFDWGTTDKGADGNPDIYKSKTFSPVKDYPNGSHYILSDAVDTGAGPDIDLVLMDSFSFGVSGGIDRYFGGDFPENIVFFFKYTDAGGIGQNFTMECDIASVQEYFGIHAGDFKKNQGTKTFLVDQVFLDTNDKNSKGELIKPVVYKSGNVKFPLVIQKGSFVIENTKTYHKQQAGEPPQNPKTGNSLGENQTGVNWFLYQGMTFDPASVKGEDIGSNKKSFTPRILKYSFAIPAREYAPDDLAETLTRAIEVTHEGRFFDNDPNEGLLDNKLLTTTENLQKIGTKAATTNATKDKDPFFVSEDGLRLSQFTTAADTSNFLMGCSQFTVEFLQNVGAVGRFQISQCHYPIFDGTASGNPIIKFLNFGAQAGENQPVRFIANKNCGVGIVNLSPPQLWYGQMSFDSLVNSVTFETLKNVTVGAGAVNFPNTNSFKSSIIDGVNTTGQLKSINAVVIKDADFDKVPTNLNFDIVTPQLIPITNKTNIAYNKIRNAYYLIEITGSCISSNTINGQGINNRIMGIVNKYYDQNSFTSSMDGEGSFTYIHESEIPMLINNFKVRILDSNYKISTDINDDNSIFLNVITN